MNSTFATGTYVGLLRLRKEIEAVTMSSEPKPTNEKAYPWYGNSDVEATANFPLDIGVEYRKALAANSAIAVRSSKISTLNFVSSPPNS